MGVVRSSNGHMRDRGDHGGWHGVHVPGVMHVFVVLMHLVLRSFARRFLRWRRELMVVMRLRRVLRVRRGGGGDVGDVSGWVGVRGVGVHGGGGDGGGACWEGGMSK